MTMAASTSNAAHSNNNSCYDVFISHSGKDVKKTFASHLYYRLVSFGLRVFLDYQELRKGEDFPCEIKGAIKNASVHIAVFSPTYAASQWCLDELVLMLETRAPIIPVFYHVEPTELRRSHGDGVYARSLSNLEKKRKHDNEPRYDSGTIENWRNALSQVADKSGFVLDLDLGFGGDEGKLLDQLVEVVLKKGKKKLDVARYPTGLGDLVKDFETKLSLQQHGERVQFVGITGLGGAGKTTLAKELFNRKSSEYSKSCFLFDVREEAKKSITSLQRKLLKGLSASKEEIDSKDGGIEILRRHFSVLSAPVLLVLDDVDHHDQVHALLPVTDKGILTLRPSSLILITSRDKNVLTRSGVQETSIYKMTGLSRERSRELFCSHAFCHPHPLSGFEPLVDQFLEACSGLPLSLKVFGGLLCRNTDKSYWKKQMKKLRKTLHKDIQKSLQVSYDALDKEEQQIFLDIACFFIGKSRDTAIRVWNASRWSGSLVFESLLSKCLVEMDIGETDESGRPSHNIYVIRMHDHLRDMGRDLANTSGFPCRLWRGTKQIEDLLQLPSEAIKVRGIRMSQWEQYYEDGKLAYSDDESGYSDERPSFSRYKMKNLELLEIDIGEDHLKCLLEAVDSPNLLWFCWEDCPCSSLPSYIPMENLRVLEVEGSELKKLWQEDVQVPLKLRELLTDAPLSKIPKSIGQLKHLERMVVVSWFWSSSIVDIPKEFCYLRSLKHLVLRLTNLSSLPDSFGNLSRLEHINLYCCSQLERLPDSFGNLSRLEHIKLSRCSQLERLPDSFGNLSRLEYIDMSSCWALKRLPDSSGIYRG
uniref:Putative truncated TIR-NBS-LRR protein n=1 Tax=Pinus monticola TaxID=3345 RepID=E9NZS7_PINMO|nr:putative truncated TIR-NBS-LRR protein [Pinus monticola]